MKFIKKSYFAMAAFLLTSALPALAASDYGLGDTAKNAGLSKTDLPSLVGSIIGYLLGLLGVIFLILTVYGGILWMTSFGNQEKVTKAKNLIIDAVIGLVIVLAAYAITTFVVGALVDTEATT